MATHAPGTLGWLLQTKLQPPPLRDDAIARDHLQASLCGGLEAHHLALLCAPAGYGKTTLLAGLPAACPHLPLAWLTLDAGDNDPALFLTYLIAALQTLNPACGAAAQALLAGPSASPAWMPAVVGAWINDVVAMQPQSFVLVLDDLHLIAEPGVYLALDYLLDHLPPQMYLALGTRREPPLALARRRARGGLAELRASDLRFTPGEADAFLNGRLQLGLPAADVQALYAWTEGWPAGLRLLAGSLGGIRLPAARADFIRRLSHTGHHVFDFLASEVLDRLDADLRRFLLQTSILYELTAPLCRAVTGHEDTQTILETLERRGLFITAIDETHSTYRYHALFAAFLYRQLTREMAHCLPTLHRRAAGAYLSGQPQRAVEHYLAAGAWEESAGALEQVGEEALQHGLRDTLIGWIHALPASVRQAHPRLLHWLGVCAWQRGETAAAQTCLRQAICQFESSGDVAGQVQATVDLMAALSTGADFESLHEVAQQTLALPSSPTQRVQAFMVRGIANLSRDDGRGAREDLQAALAISNATGTPEIWGTQILHCINPFTCVSGGLERVEHICRQAAQLFAGQGSIASMALETRYACVHLLRGRLQAAIHAAGQALALGEQLGGVPHLSGEAALALGQAHLARGDYAASIRALDTARRFMQLFAHGRAALAMVLYPLGLVYWQQGRPGDLRQVWAAMDAASYPNELSMAPVLRAMLQGVVEIAERRYAEAECTLRQAARLQEEKSPTSAQLGSARLLLAHLYVTWDLPDQALAELAAVLAACERQAALGRILQEGPYVLPLLRLARTRGVHVPWVDRLLALPGTEDTSLPLPVASTGQTLTPREVDVLRLLVQGLDNRAIAGQLNVGLQTVKTHVSRILHKLGVTSRAQAILRTRELGLALGLRPDEL